MCDYSLEFFNSFRELTYSSARVIVPLLEKLYEINSVIDVGCGTGIWLSVFRERGVEDILGIDGSYIDRAGLEIPAEYFQVADLTGHVKINRRFDLAISLEVAEHLPEVCSDSFIKLLTSLSDVILFSAAIPGQGGINHVNEQWQSYWARKFDLCGYSAVDFFRKTIWSHNSVSHTYAQNLMMYCNRDKTKENELLSTLQEHTVDIPMSIVHPRSYEYALNATNRLSSSQLISILFDRFKRGIIRRVCKKIYTVA